MANRYVYDFDEPATRGRELHAGQGVGLAEMTQMGVPVPAGFTITTDACRAAMKLGGELPEGLASEVDEHISRLEERTGKRFGSDDDPLLVSVRSGAAVSMPGMMDTILNLGLNDEATSSRRSASVRSVSSWAPRSSFSAPSALSNR
jgi:pyruvate,orthophosphate dikinase